MPTPAIRVEGIPQLRAKLRRIEGGVRDLSRTHRTIAGRFVDEVRARTRRRSGRLAAAWRAKGSARAASISNRLPYAGVQEFGWPARSIGATEAIAGVIVAQRDEIVDTYEREIRELIARNGGSPT